MALERIGFAFALLIAAGAAGAANVQVNVGGRTDGYYGGTAVLRFTPANLTINAGDTVTFINDGGFHNVAADDGSFRCANGCDGDGQGGNGTPSDLMWTAQVRFTHAGTFGIHCDNHRNQGMVGTINVRAATPTLGPGFSGAWYNASQSGHGFLVEVLPNNVLLAIWFVYSPDGTQQNWILAQGNYDPASSSVTLPAFFFQNGRFPPNFDAARVTSTPWGSLTLSFSDCTNGTASWAPTMAGYTGGSMGITRLAAVAGTSCP